VERGGKHRFDAIVHQAKGRRMTGPDGCPYGWRPDPADPDQLVADADEQATIRRNRKSGVSRRRCITS